LAAGWEECVEWEIHGTVHPLGYPAQLVTEVIAAVRTDLDAFEEAEQAVLENHGYLLADEALRGQGLVGAGATEPPHPHWMDEQRVREALSTSSKRKRRLPSFRAD
jgi:NTE family protein